MQGDRWADTIVARNLIQDILADSTVKIMGVFKKNEALWFFQPAL